ncbi:family 16 glycosylhydrolase [Wenyingzhuangia sp. IMCC45574]
MMNSDREQHIKSISFLVIFLSLFISCGNDDTSNSNIKDNADTNPSDGEVIEEVVTCAKVDTSIDIVGTLSDRTNMSDWVLEWEDDFNYPNEDLDLLWESQNSAPGHILSSRWRENAVVTDGVLELLAKKENRGGKEWTTGNIWTRQKFGYGYYECKFKYAGAAGTNNSFWLFPRDKGVGSEEVICELDVNEGHFPNEVNTNRHHWQRGTSIKNQQIPFAQGLSPAYTHTLEKSITTNKIRFSSHNAAHFHIREFRIYQAVENCNYPIDVLNNQSRVNLASQSTITASGVFNSNFNISDAADGTINKSWVSQKEGEKWLEFSWSEPKEIGHIQFVNGWQSAGEWKALITDYKIEAYIDGSWKSIAAYDVTDTYNYAEDYHIYGMEWNETELKFYFDDQLIRTIPNTLCNEELNIYLSLAILEHAGEVTDAIDGTSMKIDWVKYYKKK